MGILVSVFLALFLPCLGIFVIFMIYMCLLWCATKHQPQEPVIQVSGNGLSPSDLQKLPTIAGKDLVTEPECAVCLDNISDNQPARVIPGCNHGFHLECADTWLSRNPVCPVCRTKLDTDFFTSLENPC